MQFYRAGFFFVSALFMASRPAYADLKEAQRWYLEGGRLERAADYQGALTAYQYSLQAEPKYFYSYRQIGLCQQMLGHSDEAVSAFDTYLSVKPDDLKIQELSRSLKEKASLVASGPPPPPAPPAFKRRFGLSLLGGYGIGNTGNSGGNNAATNGGYPESAGSGLAYSGDLLWDFMPQLEFGLGPHPVSMHRSGSSASSASWVNADDSYETGFNSFPVLASLYFSLPLSGAWSLRNGLSLGTVPGFDINYSDTTVYHGMNQTVALTGKFSAGMALAYGGTLGGEYRLGPSFSLFFGADMIASSSPPVARTEEYVTTQTSSGNLVSKEHDKITYSYNPPLRTSVVTSNTTVINGSIRTTTFTQEWGSGKEVQVTTQNFSTGQTTVDTSYEYYEANGNTYDVLRVSGMLGLIYRF